MPLPENCPTQITEYRGLPVINSLTETSVWLIWFEAVCARLGGQKEWMEQDDT